MANNKLIINLHGIGKPVRTLELGEQDYIIGAPLLEYLLDMAVDKKTIITVDDGNISDINIILPNLIERNLKAMFFIPVGKIGQKGYLREEDIITLQQEGMVIGSHGVNHVNWRNLNNNELKYEVTESKRLLENILGSPVIDIACPFGAYDRRVLQFIKKAGYQKTYTSDKGMACLDDWLISRNTLSINDNQKSISKLLESNFSFKQQIFITLKKGVKRWR